MKTIISTLYFSILFSFTGFAQSPQFQWVNQLGGKSDEYGGFVAIDSKGNTFTATRFTDTISFKPGTIKELKFFPSAPFYMGLLLTKVDAGGNLLWSRQIGNYVEPEEITVDSHDNVIVTGTTMDTVDFDPGPGVFNLTGYGTFIVKLDENGNFVWAGNLRGGRTPYALVTDKKDNIGLVFRFFDNVDVDMSDTGYHLLTSGISFTDETAVLKLDSSGRFLWAHHLKDIEPYALCFDSIGNLYTAGSFTGTRDFNFGSGTFNMKSLGVPGTADAYVLKEDTSGKFIWAKSFGDYYASDYAGPIALDKNENVIISGNTGKGNGDFDPGPGMVDLVGNTDFLLKLNKNGNYIWVNGYNADTSNFYMNSIGFDDSNYIYLGGMFENQIDFNAGIGIDTLSPLFKSDGYILRLDSNGNFNWVNQLKCSGELIVYVNSMHVNKKGDIYFGGMFTSSVDFDPGLGTKSLSSVGKVDIFTLKLSSCLFKSSLSLSECRYFEYGGYKFDSSGIVDVSFVTKDGCDSVVTVDVNIKSVNDSIVATGSTITSASASGTSYQWVKCPSYTIIPGATLPAYSATTSGSYALIITENGCTDTSVCINVKGLRINEEQSNQMLTISPSPTYGKVHLQFEKNIRGTLLLRSVEGRVLYQAPIEGREHSLDISSYASGLYFVEIKTSEGLQILKKIIKN